ncbi:LysE family transporter [[Eubacterium] cellulosolvens]
MKIIRNMPLGELSILAIESFLVGFSGAIVPGPVFISTVAHSFQRGYLSGPLVVLGHMLIEIPMILALSLGLSHIVGSYYARIMIGIAGGLFLLWMSVDLFKFSKIASFRRSTELSKAALMMHGPTLSGLTLSFMNPYFFIWWATVGNNFIFRGLEIAGIIGIVVFTISHWMSDLSWYTAISSTIAKGRTWLNDRTYRLIILSCAIFLIFLGFKFIFDGINFIQP